MTINDPSTVSPAIPEPGGPESDERTTSRFLDEAGGMVRFAVGVAREFPTALRFPSEILRQAAIIALSSALVVWAFLIVLGVIVAEFAFYVLGQLGAQSYVGVFNAAADVKAAAPVFFGFICAGKIGCGFCAELGAMRINEEIDAMTVMGLPARAYLVGTRVLGFVIVVPLLWLSAICGCLVASYVTDVFVLQAVSSGGYYDVFWSFTTMTDIFLTSLVWACLLGIGTIVVGCYYGFTVRGGPVEVGDATARSMTMNVMLASIIGAGLLFQIFYGTSVTLPIGN